MPKKRNNVIISLLSILCLPDGSEERMEQTAVGRLDREGEAWLLTYREDASSGLGNTRTTLRIEGKQAILTREGEVTSEMCFREGEAHSSIYETPYGALDMTIRTGKVSAALDGKSGSIELNYHVELGGALAGENRLRVDVRERERR